MSGLFLKFLNISITAGWLVLGILLIRILLRKTPKWLNCMMWGLVGLRLVFPFSIESAFSLIPSKETISKEILYAEHPTIQSGSTVVNEMVNPMFATFFEPTPANVVNPMQSAMAIVANVWVVGMVAMLVYVLFSSLCLRKKMKESVHVKDNIWMSDYTDSAFVFGVFRPRIYISSSIKEEQIAYVIAHEQAHILRKDHWWKPLGFLLLTMYWFQPLIWIAYLILCRDIEYACDEYVVKRMQMEDKKAYSLALLECSIVRKMITACPVAFGEVSVERRVKTVLNYKKPAVWISILGIVICVVLGVGFLTNPIELKADSGKIVSETYIMETNKVGMDNEYYLSLLTEDQFVVEDEFRNSDSRSKGTYIREGNRLTLQFDNEETYELQIEGDELVFQNQEKAGDFISDAWNAVINVNNDRFQRQSNYTLLERGWPRDFVTAMDNATKKKLVEDFLWPASFYESYYFDKDGNAKRVEMRSGVQYLEIDNISDYVLKLNLMVLPVSHIVYGDNYYEWELDGVNVFCTYKWLQPPSSFGKEYKMRLTWDEGYFQMTENGFVKIDKYNAKTEEYVSSYETEYTSGGATEGVWYTDVKGTLGIAPESLYGCGMVAMKEIKDIDELNINFTLDYEVNGKVYQAVEEFSWEPTRVEVIRE